MGIERRQPWWLAFTRRNEEDSEEEERMTLNDKEPEETEETEEIEEPREKFTYRHKGGLIGILTAAFLTLATAIVAAWYFSSDTRAQSVRPLPETPCGTSPEEALSLGCIFDVMMTSWLPPSCYDDELTKEFRRFKDWTFFRRSDLTEPIDEEDLSQSKTAYTTLEYHLTHCSFAMRRLHRALEQDGQVQIQVASSGHTDHCMRKILNAINGLKSEANYTIDSPNALHPALPKCVYARDITYLNDASQKV